MIPQLRGIVAQIFTPGVHRQDEFSIAPGRPRMLLELAYRLAVAETPFIETIRQLTAECVRFHTYAIVV